MPLNRGLICTNSATPNSNGRAPGAVSPTRTARWASVALIVAVLSLIGIARPLLLFAQAIIAASPDTTIALAGGLVAADESVALDNQMGIVVAEDLGSLAGSSDVIALGLDIHGDRLISFATTVSLPGSVVVRPGDVARFDGTTYSIEFDASAAGLPTNVRTDAVSLSENGLLLSFDTTVDLGGGIIAADEDLVEWTGSAFSILLDGSAEGVDGSLDIDGAQAAGLGQYLVSFDTAGSLSGVAFSDEDIIRFDGTSWSLELDVSTLDANWEATDLDAMMVPEPGFPIGLAVGVLALSVLTEMMRRPRVNGRLDVSIAAAITGIVEIGSNVGDGNTTCP